MALVISFQGGKVFYFKLYDDPLVKDYSASVKNKIIYKAVKLSRKEYPLNFKKRLAVLFGFVFLPAGALYYFFDYDLALSWTVAMTMVLGIKLDSMETPYIKPFLALAKDQVTQEI